MMTKLFGGDATVGWNWTWKVQLWPIAKVVP
jgi:hypothetical protein